MEEPSYNMTEHASLSASMPALQLQSAIEAFPANDQSVSELAMKNMLLSLRQTLHTDLSAVIAPISNTVQEYEWLQHIEMKMGKMFMAQNELVATHTDHETATAVKIENSKLRGPLKKE